MQDLGERIYTFIGKMNAEKSIQENIRQQQFKIISCNENKKVEKISCISQQEEQKMKNIRKRKDGRWEARIQISGNKYNFFADTQEQCLRKLNAFKKSIKQKATNNSPYPKMFSDFCIYWFANYKKGTIKTNSEENYINYIRRDLSQIKCATKDLSIDILQKFINGYPPTRSREIILMILKQILKKAFELDITKKNLGEFLVKGKIQRKKIEWFDLNEQKLILSNLTNDYFSLTIYTLLLTGCRPSELTTIKKTNIKNGLVLVEGTKTKNAKRWIKISPFLEDKLRKQQNNEIFKNFNTQNFRQRFQRFLKRIRVKGTPYMLRHTFATNLFYLGVPDKERQSYMGHASSVLTNDIYTDFDPNITKKDILNLYINLYPQF